MLNIKNSPIQSPVNPKIAVIIPIYNSAAYLDECINSVLNQTFNDYEIVLVNDASTDNSREIATKYVNSTNIKLINFSQNKGVVTARNVGISEANAEYIFPLDSDDKIAPDCLELLYKKMQTGKYGVVYSQTHFFGGKNGLFKLAYPTKGNMKKNNRVVCSGLYRKTDWEKYGGYDTNMDECWEDWEFWLNFVQDNKKFYRINKPLFFYRCRNYSRNTKVSKIDIIKSREYIQKKHAGLYANSF